MFAGLGIGNTRNSPHDVQQKVRRSISALTGSGSLPIRRIRPWQRWHRHGANPITFLSSICFMAPTLGHTLQASILFLCNQDLSEFRDLRARGALRGFGLISAWNLSRLRWFIR